MSSLVETFIQNPSEAILEQCTKEQLLKISEHYEVDIPDRKLKETVKTCLKCCLIEAGILSLQPASASVASIEVTSGTLTFEQQKELLQLQLKQQLELERLRFEKEVEIETIKHKTERAKLDVQQYQLELVKEGKLSDVSRVDSGKVPDVRASQFDLVNNLRLLPKFNETDPDTFFSLFERIADGREWSDLDRTMLLQCVLTGKAQEAYSALSVADSKIYDTVKSAVLKVYELVPEAYRQRFRSRRKLENQTYTEFGRDLISQFNRWCTASKVDTFEDLCNLVVLEQLKNSVPERVATFINEHNVKTPREAAVLADEYVLTHKSFDMNAEGRRKNDTYTRQGRSKTVGEAVPQKSGFGGRGGPGSSNTCRYCQARGHWKNECPVLKARRSSGQVKPAVMAAPVLTSERREFGQLQSHTDFASQRADYSAFISDGLVSLVGSSVQVPIKILRDTGALDSFILKSVLPFSSKTDTGECVIVLGMGLVPLPVPLHQVSLTCGLVQGEVSVGVRPQLPVDGVHMIFGE